MKKLLAAALMALAGAMTCAPAQAQVAAYTDTANGARITVPVSRSKPMPMDVTTINGVAPDTGPVATTGSASTDGSTTITAGGTAQALFSGATPANGYKVAIPAAAATGAYCFVSDTTTTPSATTLGSYPIPIGGQYSTEPGERPAGAVYLNCPTTGQVFSAKKW